MSDTNVLINWKTGDAANDRHIMRYRRCLYELIKELQNVSGAEAILSKYHAALLDDHRVSLSFPDDFDQSVLPDNSR